jgi:hypothetical protein
MKKTITLFCLIIFAGLTHSQQASDYFPEQTGFEWELKAIPLDSVSNPINSLAYYRIDLFESVENYEGKLANIVLTKSGPLQTIHLQPYLDSLFYHTDGTDGYTYLSISNVLEFLLQLDSLGIDPNFNFVEFFTSLQDWYSTYRFASGVGTEYTLLQIDTSITVSSVNFPIRIKYLGTRLEDETIPTILGSFDCKKFLIQWKISTFIFTQEIPLLTLNDTIWIAPDNWIVQDIIPGQYVDNLSLLGIEPFSIPGLEIKLTDEIVSVVNDESATTNFYLLQNYPNPFNPLTTIEFNIQESGLVKLIVYDVLGNEVATLVNEEKLTGTYEVIWNAEKFSSGIYFYKISAGNFLETKKMLLLK